MATALSANQRVIVFLATGLMIAEGVLLPALGPVRVMPAVAVDSFLCTGLVLAYLARVHGGWESLGVRHDTWARGLVYGTVVAGIIVRIGGVPVPLAISVLLEIGIVALVVTGVVRIPRTMRHAVRAELRLLGAVVRALLGRPIASPAISFTRESTYPSLAIALGIVVLVEGSVLHLLLHDRPAAQSVLLAIHVYSLIWLIGDLRALRESTCRFERSAVTVELGFRGAARVPFHVIDAASAGEPAAAALEDVFHLTPGDPPNLTLELRKPIVVRGFLGIRRRVTSVRLYVDAPVIFLTHLRAAMAGISPSRRGESNFPSES